MRKIAIITNKERDRDYHCAIKAVKTLLRSGCGCAVDESEKEIFLPFANEGELIFCKRSELLDGAFCAVAFGGDGTIMRLSHEASVKNVPLLGVNLGRVGYLSEIEPSEIGLIGALSGNGLTREKRMMLRSSLLRDSVKIWESVHSLNDIVAMRSEFSSMTELILQRGDDTVGSYVADGLIIATPTGSTAYSLAAGGPVIDTSLECMCVTPIAPQSFYSKPIIFGGDSVIKIRKGPRGHGTVYISCDGGEHVEMQSNDVLVIDRSPLSTEFLHIKETNFCNVLNNKMSEMR